MDEIKTSQKIKRAPRHERPVPSARVGVFVCSNAQSRDTVRQLGKSYQGTVIDRRLEERVIAEKRRLAAHLADDRSTAQSPGRVPDWRVRPALMKILRSLHP